jgi:uncharacterized protein (DUF488 family)
MADLVYTIGHSTHSIEGFIELLVSHGATVVADVRSRPYSRFNPQFNRESLRADLKKVGISYVFLGRELGARCEDRACYVDGTVQYDLLARTGLFQEGLERVAEGASRHRIALMCAEKDPLTCHRAILVCRHLATRGIAAQHILEDGRLEIHDDAISRLLTEVGIGERDLFRGREELTAEAYDRRGRQIAYTDNVPSVEEPVPDVER